MAADQFELNEYEIVVLNQVIHTLTERPDFEALVPERADRQALHNLLALLERNDPYVLSADYDEHVRQARARLLPDDD